MLHLNSVEGSLLVKTNTAPKKVKTINGVRENNILLVTISQGIGGDGVAMARRVSKVLNVGLYDDSKLRAEAIRPGLGVRKLEGFKQKASALFGLMRDRPAQVLD